MVLRRHTRFSSGKARNCILALALVGMSFEAESQIDGTLLTMRRGMLWQSLSPGKVGPPFSNWGRRGIGLDWPGFDEIWIAADIGGPPSHMVSGGFYVGCKKDADTVLSVEDWAFSAGSISSDPNSKYIVTRHRYTYPNGANWWHAASAGEGEEVIESVWEYNMDYLRIDDRESQIPMRVTRTAHQWSGSRRDENYVLYEYVFKNISPEIKLRDPSRTVPDTLVDFYALAMYGMQVNSRAWSLYFPTLPSGSRNTWFFYTPSTRLMWGRASDYLLTPSVNEEFMPSGNQGQLRDDGTPTGEWLAPGFVGVKLLYASPDNTGQQSRVARVGWSGASPSIDLGGPFTGKSTLQGRYDVLRDMANAANFISSSADTLQMRKTRVWSLMSLGPWTIAPGDSIVIAVAEIVDGVDYHLSATLGTAASSISGGAARFNQTAARAQFTFDQSRITPPQGFNHPDPPPAPAFSVGFYDGQPGFAATVVTWGSESEGRLDPDDGTDDLAGYRLYRSSHLPIGPWDTLGVVQRGDPLYFDAGAAEYRFIDSSGGIGTNYYYALTAYDTGKVSWPPNLAAIFPETGSNRVPPLESSIFANRTPFPFKMTLPAVQANPSQRTTLEEIFVVPNPVVLGEGFTQTATEDFAQFVNIPNPCTIRIYTVRGDHVKTIDVPDGSGGIASWNLITDYGQPAASGVYLFHLDSPFGIKRGKFAVVR